MKDSLSTVRGITGLSRLKCRLAATNPNGMAGIQKSLTNYDSLHSPLLASLNHPDRQVDSTTYASLIRWCGDSKALSDGRRVHAHITASGNLKNTFLTNLLVQMYGKCGSVEDAWNVFITMDHRDTFSWNFMISVFVQNGHELEALQLYRDMQLEGVEPDKCTFFPILSAVAALGTLAEVRQIHAHIVASGLDSDITVRTALVNMYGKCNRVKDARTVFDKMPQRDVVLWNAIIAVYAQNGSGKEALQLFRQMGFTGFKPNRVTFLNTLEACATLESVEDGKVIHDHIVESGFDSDVTVRNALVNMYGKCGDLKDAWRVFHQTQGKDVISWNSMISAFLQNGYSNEALKLFTEKMYLEGIKPDRITFLSLLHACSRLGSLRNGRAIHEHIVANGLESDTAVRNALINMYGKCSSPESAFAVFTKMNKRDVISWSAMIAAYAQNGHGNEALALFKQMGLEVVKPNAITFLSMLDACSSLASLENGRVIHEHIVVSGFDSDVMIRNALVHMYGKCGSPKDARLVFDKMHQRDVISWNAMIAAYAQNEHSREALELFRQMDLDGIKPTKITFLNILDACTNLASFEDGKMIHEYIVASGFVLDVPVKNALINMYGKCGSVKDANMVFHEMHERDVISWSTMIAAYAQNGHGKEALELFRQMNLNGIKPNIITFLSTLDACASLSSLKIGKAIHECIIGSGFELEVAVRNALVNMYRKCGSLIDAQVVFDEMHERDLISWNAIIATYAQYGSGKEALELFGQMEMENTKPDIITFLNILNVCSHTGILHVGWRYFISMNSDYGITPLEMHYVCMSDILGRAGHLDEAEDLIANMPAESCAIAWGSLLGACRIHGDVRRGVRAAEHVLQLDPHNGSPYILLSNIHAAAGRWGDAIKLKPECCC